VTLSAVVCRPGELGAGEMEQWRRCLASSGLESPFLTPEYVAIIGDLFPQSSRVGVIHDGNDLVGFLPFSAHRFGRATGVGEFLTDVQAFIPSGGEWSFREVLRAAGIDLFEFAHLVASQVPRGETTYRSHALVTADLGQGFDHYLAQVRRSGGKFVKTAEWRVRRLERDLPDLRFEFGSRDLTLARRLVAWKSAQIRSTGVWDMYSQLPGATEYAERVAGSHGPGLVGSVSTLHSGDRLIAGSIDARFGQVQAGFLTAYDPQEAGRSPGAVCILKLLEAAAGSGIRSFHLGMDDEEFKRRLATNAIDLAAWQAGRPRIGTRVARGVTGLLRSG
jgi:CelD/BcsL family acetyltransferase involved in cellulose biosynthesis